MVGHGQGYVSTCTNMCLHVTLDLWGAVCLPLPSIQGLTVQRHAPNALSPSACAQHCDDSGKAGE